MNSYRLVMTPEFYGLIERGAFDHWKGETVPVRGPNREIVGEATIADLDHRPDGVCLTIETDIDPLKLNLRGVAETIAGISPMSFGFSLPETSQEDYKLKVPEPVFIPQRDDAVATWLKAKRDAFDKFGYDRESHYYWAIDDLLDEYRARADYGLTLDDDMSELEGKW